MIGIKLQELVPFLGQTRSSSPLDPFFPISFQSPPMTSALPTSPSIKERPCFVVQPKFDSNISAKTTKSSNISEFPVRIARGQIYIGWHHRGYLFSHLSVFFMVNFLFLHKYLSGGTLLAIEHLEGFLEIVCQFKCK